MRAVSLGLLNVNDVQLSGTASRKSRLFKTFFLGCPFLVLSPIWQVQNCVAPNEHFHKEKYVPKIFNRKRFEISEFKLYCLWNILGFASFERSRFSSFPFFLQTTINRILCWSNYKYFLWQGFFQNIFNSMPYRCAHCPKTFIHTCKDSCKLCMDTKKLLLNLYSETIDK